MVQEECKQSPTESANPKAAGSPCEVCKTNPPRYKCPGCYLRTCSLSCVQAHKHSTGCNRKRRLTQFVPLSEFDDNVLISDYNLLEDVKRVAESAHRKRAKLCGDSYKLPFPLKSLKGAAASRRTKILFLASGMKKVISWTIEWRFHFTDVVLHNHGVEDNTSLSSVTVNHFEPGPFIHRLKRFCEEPLQSLKFFVRKFPKLKSPFVELDIEAPIREQLANLVIIEYPVIHVFLPSHHYDFEVIKVANHKLDHMESIRYQESSSKGVLFREDEIKEESSSDPMIKYAKQEGPEKMSLQTTGTERKLIDMPDNSSCAVVSEKEGTKNDIFFDKHVDEQLDFSCNSTVEEIIDKMDPELVEELLGPYSDLITESGDDDFYNLDGLFGEVSGLVETNELANSCKDLPVEELEEGEIVEELEEGEIRE